MGQPEQQLDFASITADIVSSYVANNSVHRAELPNVIASVHAALQGLVASKRVEPEKSQPPVSIRKSITPDFLISLEDGKKYKSLKRHLRGRGLTPNQYRAKWELPADYPMVAPNYALQRSELAKSSGLGQRIGKTAASADGAPKEKRTAPVARTKSKRVRPSKRKTSE